MQKIGEALLDAGMITPTQLSAALGEQARWGNRLGETLVQLGFLPESALIRVLSERVGFPAVDLNGRTIPPDVLELIPSEIAGKYAALPIVKEREAGREILYVAMEDPSNLTATDDLTFRTGCELRPCLAGPIQIRKAISLCYDGISFHERPVELDLGDAEPLTSPDHEAQVDEHWIDGLETGSPGHSSESPARSELILERESPARSELILESESPARSELILERESPARSELILERESPARSELILESESPARSELILERESPARSELVLEKQVPADPGASVAHADAEKSEVPTRKILQGLTRLLIEKNVIEREELVQAIKKLGDAD